MRKPPSQGTGIVPQLLQVWMSPPDKEKPLDPKITVQFEIRESQWEGMKRSKKIFQQGWTESNGGIYILTS
jgi:hypothetical protein